MKIVFVYHIILANGQIETRESLLSKEPTYEELENLLKPIIRGDIEHVSVLCGDKQMDMFVDEVGLIKALPTNFIATAIYQNAIRSQFPNRKFPDGSLGFIAGTAVIFDQIVWT